MHDTSYRQYAQWRIKMCIAQSLLYPSEVISELITQCVWGGETYANCCNTKNKVIRTVQRYRFNSSEEEIV